MRYVAATGVEPLLAGSNCQRINAAAQAEPYSGESARRTCTAMTLPASSIWAAILSPLPRQHRLYFFPLPQGHGSFLPAMISFNSGGSHPAEHKAKNKAKPQEPPGQDPSRRFVTVAREYVDKDDYD